MADPKRPLLNLDTISEVPLVAIDGKDYPLQSEEALSILDIHRMKVQGKQLRVLMDKDDDLTDQEQLALTTLINTMCREVLDAPEEVHKKLSDRHRLRILETFSELLLPSRQEAGASMSQPATGERSPRVSSGSTAETR